MMGGMHMFGGMGLFGMLLVILFWMALGALLAWMFLRATQAPSTPAPPRTVHTPQHPEAGAESLIYKQEQP